MDCGDDNRAILCPFHAEKTPSFKIYDDENRFYCFGCGAHGDIVDFISRYNGISPREAVDQLREKYGLDTSCPQPEVRELQRMRAARKKMSEWRTDTYVRLCDAYKTLRGWMSIAPPDERALLWMSYLDRLDWLTDVMAVADSAEIEGLWRDGKEIDGIIGKINTVAGRAG